MSAHGRQADTRNLAVRFLSLAQPACNYGHPASPTNPSKCALWLILRRQNNNPAILLMLRRASVYIIRLPMLHCYTPVAFTATYDGSGSQSAPKYLPGMAFRHNPACLRHLRGSQKMVPESGLEPPTSSLRMRCSTT